MVIQTKPPVNHDDWTPLREEWLTGKWKIEYQMVNLQPNIFLPLSYKMFLADRTHVSLEQREYSAQYAEIVKDIMKHRGLMKDDGVHLWLDDFRNPFHYHHFGWLWVKTADEAITWLDTGLVVQASLDHDLTWFDPDKPDNEKTGYDVICWMEEHGVWPKYGTKVHSQNPVGADKMRSVIDQAYNRS